MTSTAIARLALLVLVVTPAVRARGQVPTHVAAVDSSNVAQAAWLRGVAAYQARDARTAHAEFKHAALAWPVQPGYLWGRVVTAATLGDSADVLAGLRGYASIGLGRAVWDDSLLRSFHELPAFRAVVMQLDSNIAPLARSHRIASMSDSTFWPEGIDFDARTGNYYLASIRHRTIAELRPDGTVRELWARHRADMGALMGVRVDPRGGVLWATLSGAPQMEGYAPADSGLAALVRIRIADGVIERRWDIAPVTGGHALGDLAISPLGDVFMTDSYEPVLYRLRAGEDTLQALRHPLFRSLQGMAPTADGTVLFVADYVHGLLRVDLASGSVVRIDDAPGTTSLGCDGIVLDAGGAIIAVQNGVTPARIVRFILADDGRRIRAVQVLDRNTSLADEPTIGTLANGQFVYVANSQWDKHDRAGKVRPGAVLTPPLLLGIPLQPGPQP